MPMLRLQPQCLSLFAVVIGATFSGNSLAQIATDGTLGPARALTGPDFAITSDLGRQVGANLFHSFSTFNLITGESATFSGPAGTANIINRVTGGTASSIDGLLRSTIAGANLYLINPKGVLFGPHASLDLTGSFHASSADYLKLGGGGRFDATNPGASVLTAAAPEAFGFLGPNAGPVQVQGSRLSVPEGSSVSLIGGPVTISDAALRTIGGDIRIVAAGGIGEVPVDVTAASLAGMTLAPISIERSTLETTSGTGTAPGRIVISGGQITIVDSNLSTVNHEAVDAPPLELAASGDLAISSTNITSTTDGAGRGADLMMSGLNISVDGLAQILAQTWSSGTGGSVGLSAAGTVQVTSPLDAPFTSVYSLASGSGPGGAVTVSGDTVSIKSGNVYSEASGSGSGGSVLVQGGDVSVTNGGFVVTFADPGSSGNAGNVTLLATRRAYLGGTDGLVPPNPSNVFSETYGSGNAGDVTINAPEIATAGGIILSETQGTGNAGSVRLSGEVIRLHGGPGIELRVESGVSNFSPGRGGNVEIHASREFELSGATPGDGWTRIAAATQGSGHSGDVIIESPSILIDKALIFSRTRFGTGDQGGIILRGGDIRLQNYGQIVSATEAERNGSFILIEANSLQASDSSYIQASTGGSGNAGRITINAQRVKLTGASSIMVNSSGTGNAGDMVLNIGESFEISERSPSFTRDLFFAPELRWPGGLSSEATGGGNAGTIVLRAPSILLDDGRILTTAVRSGHGGRVEIYADNLVMRNGSQIDAKSAIGSTGNAGSIEINVAGRFEISGLSPVDGAFSGIYAQTQGSGQGGSIDIGAGTLTVDGGLIRSSTSGSGSGGTIRIRAGDVVVANGGWIDAGTAPGSTGNGGRIDIVASGSIVVQGTDAGNIMVSDMERQGLSITPGTPGRSQGLFPSTISSNTESSGAGGDISLSARQISVESGGRVSANSSGAGNAGNIFIQAPDWLKLTGGTISTQAETSDGGNIDIRAGNRVHLRQSEISTSVGTGSGSGGNIFIDPTFVILESSSITANAFGGAGGNINILSDFFLASPDSVIDASSQLGVSGSVQIAAPRTEPSAALAVLPAAFLDISALLRESCAGRAGPHASSLVGVGRGGVAAAPDGYSASRYFGDTILQVPNAGDVQTPRALQQTAPSLLLAASCRR